MRQGVVKRASKPDVTCKLAVLRDDLGDLLAVAGNVPEAQDRPATRNAAVGLHVAAGARTQQQIERLTLRKEGVELRFEISCRLGLKPGAEAHEELGIFRKARHARQRVRGDAHVLALLPEDQDLRLGLDNGVCRGKTAPQFDDLVAPLPHTPALLEPGAPDERHHRHCGAGENRTSEEPAEFE